MERYIYNSVYNIVEPLIDTHQHGLMTGKSCTTQLLSVYDTVGKHLDEGKQTDMRFWNFQKRLTRLITTCLLLNYKNLDFLVNYYFGLPITEKTGPKEWCLMVPHLSGCLLHLVYRRDQYLVHYYFYSS